MPLASLHRSRRATTIENDVLRVTVLLEGGHIAEVLDKTTSINPLWSPPWESIEPSAYVPAVHDATFGSGPDARLLAGIMGHNLCLDIFGVPSDEEAAAGLTAHGEASIAPYEVSPAADGAVITAVFPLAHLQLERHVALHGTAVRIRERITSRLGIDRPIAWTQHVTLGPPFLENGATSFRASATRSQVFESTFGAHDYLQAGASFDWPRAPRIAGGFADLRLFTSEGRSSAYTAHLMSGGDGPAYFVAFSPRHQLAFGYMWKAADFPWMGIWEENRSRAATPWNGATLARGMEFGVSPYPETRRAMIERGRLFATPTYRWLPANGSLEAEYWIVLRRAATIPERLDWPE
ncbi:MAG TPA: hypothetical protein VKD69_04240 [Vicinamibacterales bacterium]|nr:hypothetical protein [Vicinamibacterales bacterium]